MKNKVKVLGAFLLTSVLLGGCGLPSQLYYKDEKRPISEIEEMLSDSLESENPNHEIEVIIKEDD